MFAGYAPDAVLAGPSAAIAAAPKDAAPQKTQATKEQLEKAEADRKQLEEQLANHCKGLSAEERELILARTNGLAGDALVTEMAAIENAMVDKDGVPRANADRALGAYADVAKLAADAEAKGEHGAHITPEIMSELVTGVAEERAKGEDERGILGRRNAREAAKGLIAMTPENFARTEQLLRDAKTDADGNPLPEADAAAQQALLLKAVGARRDGLS